MSWIPLRERINTLPLILAGPILRGTQPNAVTVWVALKESCNVTLEIFDTRNNLLITGSRKTIQLGTNLHVVAVTASSVSNILLPGENYLYNLDFGNSKKLNYPGILNPQGSIDIAYPPYHLPSFALPPQNLNELRILHGSCRKLHGENLDALAALDKMIREALAQDPKKRPHQLFLTGDQIYVDDVADCMLFMLMDASKTLLGWSESLPDVKNIEELLPGKRNNLATNTAGLTASLDKLNQISNLAKSHLFTFGEFMTMYLFAWSDTLWISPEDLPQFSDINSNSNSSVPAEFEKEVGFLKESLSTLKEVRRGLANIPTYMIFDDHEITDDWNLNMGWCDRVLSKPLGRRILQNGLLAYSICQAWGNTPNQFIKDNPGAMLLKAAETWSASGGQDDLEEREITLRIGLPTVADIKNTNPRQLPDYDTAIDWHYTVTGPGYEVIVLNTRTLRGFPGRDFDFPALLSQEACHKQISIEINSDIKVTFVISPSPLIGLPFLEGVQKYATKIAQKLGTAAWGFDPEAWGLELEAFEQLLARLALRALPQPKSQVILLSGDVHYSFSSRLQYSAIRPFEHSQNVYLQMVIAQFTSSSLKNEKREAGGSYSLHLKGFIPFKVIDHHPKAEILGWTNPSEKELKIGTFYTYSECLMQFEPWHVQPNPAIVDLVENRSWFRLFEITKKPEWYYRIDFLSAQLEDVNIPLSLDSQSPISIVAPLPGQDREKPLKAYLTMAKNHHDYQGLGKKPKQIVGVNNLGEITLEFTEEKQIAVQTLWWRLEGYNKDEFLEPFPLTRYEISLDFDNPEYPMEDVLKEVISCPDDNL
jgi:hypothetical protein